MCNCDRHVISKKLTCNCDRHVISKKLTYVVLRTFNLIKVNGKQIEAINLLMTGLLAVSTFISQSKIWK